MKVWRLESKDGAGPYVMANSFLDKKIDDKLLMSILLLMQQEHSFDKKNHPTPFRDNLLPCRSKEHVFGCSSLNGLKQWFGKFFYILLARGFVVRLYDTNDFHIGRSKRQISFKKLNVIEEIDLEKLLEKESSQ